MGAARRARLVDRMLISSVAANGSTTAVLEFSPRQPSLLVNSRGDGREVERLLRHLSRTTEGLGG